MNKFRLKQVSNVMLVMSLTGIANVEPYGGQVLGLAKAAEPVEVISGGGRARSPVNAKGKENAKLKGTTAGTKAGTTARGPVKLVDINANHALQLEAFALADTNQDGVLDKKEKRVFKRHLGQKKQSKGQAK